jgi:hypothetical protein
MLRRDTAAKRKFFLFLRHRNKNPAPFWHPVDVFVLVSGNILQDIVDSLEVRISTLSGSLMTKWENAKAKDQGFTPSL